MMLLGHITPFELVCLGLACGTASLTIAKAEFFKPIREMVPEHIWFGKLIRCPYCVGHWIAAGLVALSWRSILSTSATTYTNALTLFIVWLAVTGVGAFTSFGIFFLSNGSAGVHDSNSSDDRYEELSAEERGATSSLSPALGDVESVEEQIHGDRS